MDNREIAENGMFWVLIETEYQRLKLEQKAADIRRELGYAGDIKAKEDSYEHEIMDGYQVTIGAYQVPIGMILETFRMMDDYLCDESTLIDSTDCITLQKRENIRQGMMEHLVLLTEKVGPAGIPRSLKNKGMRKTSPEEKLAEYSIKK